MQVDGYSLDAQKDKLHKYADYQDMIIAGERRDSAPFVVCFSYYMHRIMNWNVSALKR